MGETPLAADGNLIEAWQTRPVGKRYLELRAELAGARNQDVQEAAVYNHLFTFFGRHLYLPLLVEESEKIQSIPPALKPSEAKFVRDLKAYWDAEHDKSQAGAELYLLRNLSKGKGVGFFSGEGFYPDFILWVLAGSRQRIVFVEPHGMVHAKAYIHDDKARLHERLPELAQEIGRRSGRDDITLDAFIVSATPYDELHERYDDGTWSRARFAEKHILFAERGGEYDYMRVLFGGGL